MTRRIDRVNVLLRQEISRVLAMELDDPRISSLASITRVEASGDLRHAKVFVSVLGEAPDKERTMVALTSAAGFMHRSLRKNLSLRTVPTLRFYIDESIEQGAEILEMIKKEAQTPPGPDDTDRVG